MAKATEAFVWVWLPDETKPVVAGRLAYTEHGLQFNYGQRYLARNNAISLYEPELPLQPGLLPLLPGLSMPGCLRDAAPDAWGRRVIVNRLFGAQGKQTDVGALDELTYLLESGSDRIGALDFQESPHNYIPRQHEQASLKALLEAASLVEQGRDMPPELARAMLHGTSIGGARPKAMINADDGNYIAKFSSSTDVYPVVKVEYTAMRLAHLAGLNVASVQLVNIVGKDVLLIERFDRIKATGGWQRRILVSALTLFELDETMARYASYEQLAENIRHRFTQPKQTLHELFGRIVFNVLCGNTDDHARNHAAFWDGAYLSLTPAYDICPQPRAGNEATQAMLIHGNNRHSRLVNCLQAAPQFLLGEDEARRLIDAQIECIHHHWDSACAEAELGPIEARQLWRRQFLNPDAIEGYSL